MEGMVQLPLLASLGAAVPPWHAYWNTRVKLDTCMPIHVSNCAVCDMHI